MYTVNDMFKRWLDKKVIEPYHPKIVAVKKELENVRDSVEAEPKGVIEIDFPIQVQTDTSTVQKYGIAGADGTKIFMAELMAFQKAYTITSADTKTQFQVDF